MQRRVAGTVIIDGTDHEYWPQSDEVVHRVFNQSIVLDVGQPAQSIDVPDVRWGGECRVEVRLTARAIDNGVVQIQGNAKFFEGVSENTNDLADEQVVDFSVPRGGSPSHHFVQLRNTEAGGGDHAGIGLSFTNSLVED